MAHLKIAKQTFGVSSGTKRKNLARHSPQRLSAVIQGALHTV